MAVASQVAEMDIKVWILRKDYTEFRKEVQSKNPPAWLPTDYRITKIEDTGYIPHGSVDKRMLVRILLQYISQTAV